MRLVLAAATAAAAFVAGPALAVDPIPDPGGHCDGAADVLCADIDDSRSCVVWVATRDQCILEWAP